MFKDERQKDIISILKQKKFASVSYLSKNTYSSEPTIRRDLILLEQKGYISRNHGGAMIIENDEHLAPILYRKSFQSKEKKELCFMSSRFLKDYQTIFLDDSSTTMYMIEYLKLYKNITVITNSIFISMMLCDNGIPFYCTGGKSSNDNCYTGKLAEDFIKHFNADILFFSSTAVDFSGNISNCNENEANIKRTMLENSKQRIYMFDESKLGKYNTYNIAKQPEIDYYVTNKINEKITIDKSKLIFFK